MKNSDAGLGIVLDDVARENGMLRYLSGCMHEDEDEQGDKYWAVEDLESALAAYEEYLTD
ncbi:hypothetical protein [Thiocapsa rosea]|nr:hypothetical protein [Thiocapsa rosea]